MTGGGAIWRFESIKGIFFVQHNFRHVIQICVNKLSNFIKKKVIGDVVAHLQPAKIHRFVRFVMYYYVLSRMLLAL